MALCMTLSIMVKISLRSIVFQETTARIQVYVFLTEIELQILKVVTRISCEIQDNGQSVLKCTDEVSSRLLVSEFTNFQ